MASSKSRIHFLDELRGLCVLLMIAFHAFYTLGYLFHLDIAYRLFWFFEPAEPFFAGIFILLCGFSCRLSRNNLKRGLLLALVAVAMSAVLWFVMPSEMIWFGVLHCLAVCILLFAALQKPLSRIPTWLGILLFTLLTILTWNVPWDRGGYFGIHPFSWYWPTSWSSPWLIPFGLGYITSADYFPLIPWVFCFLVGTYLGNYKSKLPKFTRRLHVRPLAFMGRHSLWFYLAHQPVIYGIAYLIDLIV